ncbi:CamS family sex pheromone protein [Brevibacillus sp. AY1]|uniref:CamS family sex pheromone protein n=1 Tax=Brevibacillus sp. AY1 TaxID=2807621 RepID=UPI0024574779|nr:CamS family sex pheromone protein [Brevibacillus sp. AY1]MDH4617300.1 CamS family sex pheromone protein [Brevibacillus sp. AY1]
MKAKFLARCKLAAAGLLAIVAAGCSLLPTDKERVVEPTEPSLSPVIEVSEDYYGSILPYKPNQTRGMLSENKFRIDFSHLELGMMEFARDTYPTSSFLFQEGQQIQKEQVRTWIAEEKAGAATGQRKTGLLVHVMEHNYLNKETQQLAGMALGLSLSPVYQDATGQEKRYTVQELQERGQQLATKIIQSVRGKNLQVPLLIMLYQVPDISSSLVPGNFIMSGTVNANESAISKWQAIEEEFFLFPSPEVANKYAQQSLQYDKFMRESQSFFRDFIGMTGVGRFMGGNLTELTITATAEYDSRTEVLQFTQFAANNIDQLFDKSVHVNMYVQAMNKPLAVYIRPVKGEPYMHIYR